jgi:hypothetical protein
MNSILTRAKKHLIEKTVFFYLDRREETALIEYDAHFADMGSVIKVIDEIDSFSELITKLEDGTFEVIGYFPSDGDMLEEFLNSIK